MAHEKQQKKPISKLFKAMQQPDFYEQILIKLVSSKDFPNKEFANTLLQNLPINSPKANEDLLGRLFISIVNPFQTIDIDKAREGKTQTWKNAQTWLDWLLQISNSSENSLNFRFGNTIFHWMLLQYKKQTERPEKDPLLLLIKLLSVDPELLEHLITKKNSAGSTSLHFAIVHNHLPYMQYLLKKKYIEKL